MWSKELLYILFLAFFFFQWFHFLSSLLLFLVIIKIKKILQPLHSRNTCMSRKNIVTLLSIIPTVNTNTSSFVHQRKYSKNGKHNFSLPLRPSSVFLSLPPFDYFLFPFDSKTELNSFFFSLFFICLLFIRESGAWCWWKHYRCSWWPHTQTACSPAFVLKQWKN